MAVLRTDGSHGGVPVSTLTVEHGATNVLDLVHCRALTAALGELRREDRARVVVLRGAGKRFSTGVDIQQHTPQLMPELLPAFHDVFDALFALRAVTVAAVHGHCLGGAAELVFACDRVVAEGGARIAFPEVQVGCYPPVAIAMLPQMVAHGRAVEMILSGAEVAVARLFDWGLVHRVASDGGLDEALHAELALYAGKSPAVLGMAAALLHEPLRERFAGRIRDLEKAYLRELLPHPDAAEGIAAFTEKRSPRWQ